MDKQHILRKYRAFLQHSANTSGISGINNIMFMASAELKKYSPEYEALEMYAHSLRNAVLLSKGVAL